MRNLSIGLSAVCFALCAITICFLSIDSKTNAASFYWQPFDEKRLEAKLLAGISATLTVSPDEIITLASPIAARNPRSIFARTSLAGAYLQKGDIKALEAHFFPLFNLGDSNTNDFIAILVQLSSKAEVFDVITNHIREEQPVWGSLYLAQLMNTDRDPREFQELYALYPRELSRFFAQLLQRESVSRAYEFFSQISNETNSIIIDAEFKEESLKWPFGWKLDEKIAEREINDGLSLVYFGRGEPIIMEQLAKVEQGDYKLGITLSGTASRASGYYALRLKCWKGAEVARFNVDDISTQTKELNFNFEIADEKCQFLHVQLLGQAGEFPRPVRTTVNRVQIQPRVRTETP